MFTRNALLACFTAASVFLTLRPAAAQVELFSSGYLTPETISLAPADFGAFGGQYFVPDFGRGNVANSAIYAVPTSGGTPTKFASAPSGVFEGGLFLPSTGWGSASGKYLTVGLGDQGAYTWAADGTPTFFAGVTGGSFSSAVLAPNTFGAASGKLIVTDQGSHVFTIAPDATITTLVDLNFIPFGDVFAPEGFGGVGGKLLVSGVSSGDIAAIDANGTVTPFVTVALNDGQVGLRQMIFAPAGFLPGFAEPLLLVSVTGSRQGGGVLGDVVAFNSSGVQVASLRADLPLTKFDPRGFYFEDNTHLLVNDTSDPIYRLTPNAFTTVPEPSAVAFLTCFVLIGAAFARRKHAQKSV